MLDLYGVTDLHPWPDDLPADRLFLGSIDLREFHQLEPLVRPCFAAIEVTISYVDDWVLTAAQLDRVLGCLEVTAANDRIVVSPLVDTLVGTLSRARGRSVLAVCD